MPRPTLFDHPKFHRLVYILKLPEPQVLGLLEFMWRVGYASGNPVIGDGLDVEIAAKWWGEVGVFTAAVVESRLVDKRDDGLFAIHDLDDHAPTYVQDRRRKEAERKRNKQGKVPDGHGTVTVKSGKVTSVSDDPPEKSGTPAPAPAPALKESAEEIGGPPVPVPIQKRQESSWLKPYDQDWRERFGASVPIGAACSALAALRKEHGGDVGVRPVWQWYLRTQPAEFISPMGFAKKFFHWREGMNGKSPTREQAKDRPFVC